LSHKNLGLKTAYDGTRRPRIGACSNTGIEWRFGSYLRRFKGSHFDDHYNLP